jgi:hypothetical protein
MENIISGKWNPKVSKGSYTDTWTKQTLWQKLVRRDKEGHYILMKGTIHQEYTTVCICIYIYIYTPNVGALNFIKHYCLYVWMLADPGFTNWGSLWKKLETAQPTNSKAPYIRNSQYRKGGEREDQVWCSEHVGKCLATQPYSQLSLVTNSTPILPLYCPSWTLRIL